jgi:hypothetical protein
MAQELMLGQKDRRKVMVSYFLYIINIMNFAIAPS